MVKGIIPPFNEIMSDRPTNQPTNQPTDKARRQPIDGHEGSKESYTFNNDAFPFREPASGNC